MTLELPYQGLARRLRHVVRGTGLDISSVGPLAGLGASHLSMIVRGKVKNPTFQTLHKICTTYGVSIEWLMTGVGKAPELSDIRAAAGRALEAQPAPEAAPTPAAKP